MATTGLVNALIRLLTSANVIDVEIPFAISQTFANGQSFVQGVVNAAPVVIVLPCVNVLFVYIKAVAGTLTVTWTPSGGASVIVQNIATGGFLILNNPAAGITALTISAGTYDMLLGG